MAPLSHLRVWEVASTPAVGFAGLVLGQLGARVELLLPPGGHPLQSQPPFIDGRSALEVYLTHGKEVRGLPEHDALDELAEVHVLLVDRPDLDSAWKDALARIEVPSFGRAVITCTPYGVEGPKRDWKGSELTLFQGGGEGFLTPSGLSYELFPDRPPTGVGRYLGHYQAGLTVVFCALTGLRLSRRMRTTQWTDVSIQAAQLSLNYMVVSRFVDGALEQRSNRAFTYGGVIPCSDGFVEIVPIEQHQWEALRAMLGEPEWATDKKFETGMDRAKNGKEINRRLIEWALERSVSTVIAAAREHDVPCGAFNMLERLPELEQLRSRGYFIPTELPGGRPSAFPGAPWVVDE
jgi:crotonobetainyl-CoA:carnitine CoA-transferase CaiB-like acyl-CoA transferase